MITLDRASYQVQPRYAIYAGLESDTKPTGSLINNGDEFQEINTGKTYKFDKASEQWYEQFGGGSGGGVMTSTLEITFAPLFVGRFYTIQSGSEVYSGTVPTNLIVTQSVLQNNVVYTVKCTDSLGTEYQIEIQVGTYYGVYFGELFAISDVLNENTWQQISDASNQNIASSIWSVGDAKQISLSSKTIGTVTYGEFNPWVYILGFNHNSEVEGNNRIHFGCFRTEQQYSATNGIGLDDSEYGNLTSTQLAFHMNVTNSNFGGWQDSIMRKEILDSDSSSVASGSSNSFLAALPLELLSVLKQCTKWTDNTGGGQDNPTYVTPTEDWLFLLSEFEISGTRTFANSEEQNKQKQYQYYINGNSKIKYKQSSSSEGLLWWLRSARSNVTHAFAIVNQFGDIADNTASRSWGVSPCFCV